MKFKNIDTKNFDHFVNVECEVDTSLAHSTKAETFKRLLRATFICGSMFTMLVGCDSPNRETDKSLQSGKQSKCVNGPPPYPKESLVAGEEGIVGVAALIAADGRFIRGEVRRSSGYSRLDAATVAAASTWCWKPKYENGVPVEAWQEFDYTWKLQ